MTLENLVQIGRLKDHKATRGELLKLVEAARRNLRDAHVSGISVGTRFDAAYKAVMQCALLALLAHGFRPSTNEPGHHVTVVQSLSKTIGLSNDRLVVLDGLRKKRNLNDYTGEEVSDEQASACIRAAAALLADVEAWLHANRRDLLSCTVSGTDVDWLSLNNDADIEFLGVDGCPAGWFYVGLSDAESTSFGIAPSATELAALGARAELVLIDMPIGLKEDGTAERLCDREARRVLGRPRGSSVFRAPVRQALEGIGYEDVCERNFAVSGKRMSQQGFRICGKIREIDRLLTSRSDLGSVFREMHPEVCFWALNGKRATRHGKKGAAGRQERIGILSKYLPNAEDAFIEASRLPRKEVALDDILDAMVGAVTARLGYGRLSTLPAEPERDSLGLAMEMVFSTPP